MAAPLLQTKLYQAPLRAGLVPRPALIARLDALWDCRLALVSAPAGYGKTTLIAAWAEQTSFPIAWLLVDEGDQDPQQFWAYCSVALQTVHPGLARDFQALLAALPLPPIESLLADLINEIAQYEGEFCLVLDDFHTIENPAILQALLYFIENAPPQMHWVLSSRADPPWRLARLRVRQELLEIRARELCFTTAETQILFNQILKLDLPARDLELLAARTEGWIAGLQMAALSLQGRADRSAFIADFAGSNRFIFDYLVEEVLSSQLPPVQDFLLKTAILEHFSASLCDALLERCDSHSVIAFLEQANLFVTPLDEQREWYSYHRLFRDLLRMHLERRYPQQIPQLHARASDWQAAHGRVLVAVAHAVQAGDVARIAALTEQHALELVHHGALKTLQTWLDLLPETLIAARPWLAIAYAWVLVNALQLDELEGYLLQAERQCGQLPEFQQARLSGHILSIRVCQFGQTGQYRAAADVGQRALQILPVDDPARSWTSISIAHNLRRLGDLAAAEDAYQQAIGISAVVGVGHDQVHARIGLANLLLTRGQLHRAADIYQSIIQAVHAQDAIGLWYPIAGFAHSCLGAICLEWNELDQALELTRVGLELSERWGQLDFLLSSYIQRAYALLAAGCWDEAAAVITRLNGLLPDLPAWPQALVRSNLAHFLLLQGRMESAAALVQQNRVRLEDDFGYEHVLVYLVLARVLLATGDCKSAVELLERLSTLAETAGALRFWIEIQVLRARCFSGLGRSTDAQAVLLAALRQAEPEGYRRVFTAEGAQVLELLRNLIDQEPGNSYLQALLQAAGRPVAITQPDLVESLSQRELDVMQLLITSLSVPEIAAELVISPHTVRSHIKNIYGKLGVNRRLDAIEKVKELRLI